MNKSWLVVLSVVLPFVSSFITYAFISIGNSGIALDDNQSLIILIAIIKMILLGSTGVFPIQLNELYEAFLGRDRRTEVLPYKLPPVQKFPCTRRLLCEVEAAARSSDSYLHQHPVEDKENEINPTEEVSPQDEDPLTQMHIEAIKALYREDDKFGELTPRSRRALGITESLTGQSCEEAYRRCPGRYSGGMYFRLIFDEFNYQAKDEL